MTYDTNTDTEMIEESAICNDCAFNYDLYKRLETCLGYVRVLLRLSGMPGEDTSAFLCDDCRGQLQEVADQIVRSLDAYDASDHRQGVDRQMLATLHAAYVILSGFFESETCMWCDEPFDEKGWADHKSHCEGHFAERVLLHAVHEYGVSLEDLLDEGLMLIHGDTWTTQ